MKGRVADDESWLARLLIAPAMIYIGAIIGFPFVLSIWFALSDVTVSSPSVGHFVGAGNFRGALGDPTFMVALRNTIFFSVVSQLIVIVLSAILGVALQKEFRGKWAVRLLVLLPWVAPISLGSIGWLWLLDSIYSVFNWVAQHWLHVCGELGQVSCPVWLGEPKLAMFSIISVQVWRTLPLATVILLGGMTSIPQDIHDAASIDGAGFFRTLFQITLPLLLPIMLVAILFGFIFAFTDMIVVWVLTRGGPYDTTQVLASLAFFKGIDGGDLAGASAVALFLMPVLAAAAILMLRLARRTEVV